jgi:hypothetical protein
MSAGVHQRTGRGTGSPRGNAARCPVCGTRCSTLKTNPITAEVTEITYLCRNEACGHIWVAQLAALRVIHPSSLLSAAEPAAPPAPAAGGR